MRRLAQHNGLSKGGAVRTSKQTLRPWEMVCVVAGFPSNIAALQFEWAWQNAHLTKKIPAPQRLTPTETVRISPKSGRTRHRPPKARVCLTDRLGNLHLLLRVQSFARWPLEVRFFNKEVHRVWQQWMEQEGETLSNRIKVVLDLKRELPGVGEEADASTIPPSSQMPKRRTRKDALGDGGLEGLDVGFGPLKGHVEKSATALAEGKPLQCAVCHGRMNSPQDLVATCPTEDCAATSHLTCLSRHFLECEAEKRFLLPTQGTCPKCRAGLRWIDVAKELTLRTRGKKDLERLLKKPRVKVGKKSNSRKKDSVVPVAGDDEESSETDDSTAEDYEGEAVGLRAADVVSDAPFYYPNYYFTDDVDDDVISITSAASEGNLGYEPKSSELQATGKWERADSGALEVVIEDSDWDDAEVLD
ncbi:MAG: Slx4p interacting protein [Geoglossum umbratile]|nr:MAG: Slx4p interacting protein [Geoglossum umbratile]